MEWYELDEKERIKQYYSKVTIQSFWNWWSDNDTKIMEVRIKDWRLIKEVATRFKLPYSTSGVYVNNGIQLKNVLAYTRDKATIWFGTNPRKKNKNLKGWNTFGGGEKGGSGDINIEEIRFLFIDIDRVNKAGVATREDLKQCDILSNYILERLEKEKWSESYIKICSGHGVQLIVKLDLGLVLPNLKFDNIEITKENKEIEVIHKPIITSEFVKIQEVIREGIGKDIVKFSKQIIKDKKLMVEIDKSSFRIAQVAALHCSKNFKYDTFRWRGIVDLKDGNNKGFADYIWSRETDVKKYNSKNLFVNRRANDDDKIYKGKLMQHKLIQFALEHDFGYGEINNKLWFQIKCLLRDSKIDLHSTEYIKFKREFEARIKGTLSPNLPDDKFSFSKDMINNFCLNQRLPPLYKVYDKRLIHNNFYDDDICTPDFDIEKRVLHGKLELMPTATILEDILYCKELLKYGEYNNNLEILLKFINAIIDKYDEETAKYLHKYWLYNTLEFT